jgi:PAS domain S-box-containing protein
VTLVLGSKEIAMALENTPGKENSLLRSDLLEVVPVGLGVLKKNGQFILANTCLAELLGCESAELRDLNILELLSDESAASSLPKNSKFNLEDIFADSRRQFTGEYRFIRRDRRQVDLAVRGTIFEERGETLALLSFFDVTEQRCAEEALRKSEKRFRMAEKATNDAIWEWDLNGNKVTWNQGLKSMLGYSPLKEYKRDPSWWIDKIHPDDREEILSSLGKALRDQKEFWSTEYRFLCADGHYANVSEKACIEYDPNRNPCRIIGSKTDITAIRRYQKEIEKAKEEALKAAEAKTAFLANISHEIRTPLSAIIGFTDFLLDPGLSEEQRQEYLLTVQRNAQMLSHLVDEILDLAKLEFHSMKVERIYFDFRDVLQHVNSVLKFKADEKGLQLNFKIDPKLPPYIKTDPIRLQQILINLIGNAVKFTPKGHVDVVFECIFPRSGTQDEMQLKCTIHDTGIGLNSSEKSRLFQQFAQADETTTRRFGGTGLGLFLSRELAHALGGDVVLLQSEPDQGSTFVATISVGQPQSRRPSESQKTAPMQGLPVVAHLESAEILLVEDSPDQQVEISRILEPLGAHVTLANNGFEGSDMALKGHFDLVLMDLEMPVMSGQEAIRKMRSVNYQTPVIALTNADAKSKKEASREWGFDALLSKPVERDLLLEAILKCLDRLDGDPSRHRKATSDRHLVH